MSVKKICCLLIILGMYVTFAGCGRSGPLFLPDADDHPLSQQT